MTTVDSSGFMTTVDDSSAGELTDTEYRQFIEKLEQHGIRAPGNTTLLSAHQMGSCRMAKSSAEGVCRPTGQMWECDDVWICDASVLPTASGVNPMVTTLAVCDGIAEACAKHLNR
jgi:choline dehydrogenase-like flavoprotein